MFNEASGEWKHNNTTGHIEHLFRTKTIKSTVNPEWNEDFKPFIIKTGAFEKKTKRHFHLQLTNRQKQAAEDEHMLQIMEQDELRIYFGDPDLERQGKPGARHKVPIYLGDTVRQFKNKLLIACHKEGLAERDPNIAAKYKAVKVGVKSAVTVFVPSEKLRSLFSQAREDAREYKRLYKLEEQDPSFWQPLDPIRSFSNYSSTYGFGHQTAGSNQKDPAQRLRIAEATPEYKLRNQRYKHFEEELNNCTNRLDDTDTDTLCFGYGKYTHERDNQSTEWRPVLVNRPDSSSSDTVKRTFTVEWMYAFGGSEMDSLQKQADLDEDSVVLAPRIPHILGSGTLEHQQFLEQAVDMKSQGLSESEIATQLNQKLDTKFEMAKEAAGTNPTRQKSELMKPARITESEVKHFLKKREGDEGNKVPLTPPGSPRLQEKLTGGLQSMQGMMTSMTSRTSGLGSFMNSMTSTAATGNAPGASSQPMTTPQRG
jgi:hypothetical protein